MACWMPSQTRNTVVCFTESRAILDDLGDLFVQGWRLFDFNSFHRICQGILIETYSKGAVEVFECLVPLYLLLPAQATLNSDMVESSNTHDMREGYEWIFCVALCSVRCVSGCFVENRLLSRNTPVRRGSIHSLTTARGSLIQLRAAKKQTGKLAHCMWKKKHHDNT